MLPPFFPNLKTICMKPRPNIQSMREWQRQNLERELPTGWSVEIGEATRLWTLYTPNRHAFAVGSFMDIIERLTEMNRV